MTLVPPDDGKDQMQVIISDLSYHLALLAVITRYFKDNHAGSIVFLVFFIIRENFIVSENFTDVPQPNTCGITKPK